MRTYYKILFLFFSLVGFENGSAQNFLNGSFENCTAGGSDQINMTNGAFNAMMANVTAFGSYNGGGAGGGNMDIITSSSWGGGGAQCGCYYVALTGTGTDAIALDLSAPLVAGNTYTISFYDRADAGFSAFSVEVGLSTTNTSFGTSIYLAPLAVVNTWTLRTFTFVAPNNGMYITVQQNLGGTSDWLHVDNFSFGNAVNTITMGAITGSPFCACSSINVPFTSTGTFTAGNVYSALLSDATGSFTGATTIGTLTSTANSGTIVCNLPCNAVAGSAYQIQVVSSLPLSSASCSCVVPIPFTINAAPTVAVNSPTICPGQTANLAASGAVSYTWSGGATPTGTNTATASPVTTTTYTVTGLAAGCIDTAVATVTIGGALNLSVNSPTICPGQTANLTATGAATYTWSAGATSTGAGNATANPATTTTYTVTGNSGGCTGTAVATVTVVNNLSVTVNSLTICPGQTAGLTASGANTYSWSAGATVTGTNTADVSPVTTTTYTVTGMSGACSATAVATVTVSNNITVLVNSPTICAGQTANLLATGAANYAWSAGATSGAGGAATASPASTTTYTVTGTSGTCTNTAVATVTVTPLPNVGVSSVTVCSGDTAHLSANGAQTYTWSTGATASGNAGAYALPVSTTTYTVTGTSSGCSNTAISTVTVNPTPVVTVNSATICQGQTTPLTATGANSYSWNTGFAGNPLSVTLNATTSYTVTGTSNGCSAQASATVTVNLPAVVTVNIDTICPGQTATLTAGGALTYLWSNGSTANPLVVSPPTTTTYTVTGNPNGCPGTATTTVQVQNVFPSVFVNSDSICNGSGAVLTATGAATYTWSTGATTASITVYPSVTTTYTVSTTNQCNNSASATSLVAVKTAPIALFSTVDTLGCVPLCVLFTNASSVSSGTITAWNWTFGDGQTDAVQNPAVHCYTGSGSFNVKLIVTANDGCRDTLLRTNYIHVYPYPVAAFTNTPTVTNLDNATINFFNQSAGQTTWLWSFGDTATTTAWSPLHTYTYPGTYPVMLIVSNNEGCRDTVIHYITIHDNFEFYAPNSITPNEDDINEVFLPKGTGWDLNHYQLWIFDRWGNMCFTTTDPYKGWDGRANNGSETAASDVFVYKVELKDLGGDLHKYMGAITILK